MSTIDGDTVPLKSRLYHKFYEPVVLVKALNHEMRGTAKYDISDAFTDVGDPDQLYRAFVYKLGHICDSLKGEGGRTTTSFVILKDEIGQPEYFFASNWRSIMELTLTQSYMRNILRKVGEVSEDRIDNRSFVDDVLLDIIGFNESRINHYLQQLQKSASLCRERWLAQPEDGDQMIATHLNALTEGVDLITSSRLPKHFTHECSKFIRTLEELQSSRTGHTIRDHAQEGRMHVPSQECWSRLQHMISRLVAYSQSTRFLILAKKKWPMLFQNFQVFFFLSSQKMARPFRNKSQTAESIVGRMTRKEKEIQIFRDFVRDLQMFNLDELIKAQYQSNDFRPIVHSEVLVLDGLEKIGRLNQESFFKNTMFIGSSKPTCKLCAYYFMEHKTNVGCRATHGNIYLNWRFPDVLQKDGAEGERGRDIMLNRVLQRVRKDAFDMVKKRLPSSYKEEDSHTYSAALPISRGTSIGSDSSLADAISGLRDLNLESDSDS